MSTATITQPTTSSASSIHARALLCNLTISVWTARKYDKAATAKLHHDYQTKTDKAARATKNLLPGDASEYATLITLAGEIRRESVSRTLAWGSGDGWRLLTTAAFADYTAWYRRRSAEFDAAVAAFLTVYPTLVQNAQLLLNGMYDAADYPSVRELKRRFGLAIDYAPIPAQGDVRVDLAADQISMIEQTIRDSVQASVDGAMRDAYKRLHTVAAKMAERLSDPKAVFRDTLVENVRDVVDALRTLNVTGDPTFDALRARVETELTAYSPETLRDDKAVRADVAGKAQAIVDAMAGLWN